MSFDGKYEIDTYVHTSSLVITLEDIYLLEDEIDLSDLPEVTMIDNDTFCFKPQLKAYLRCFLSNVSESSPHTMNRLWRDHLF